MGLTPIIGPDGVGYQIPAARVPDAIKAGGKLATPMFAPDGSTHLIPNDQVTAAQQAGGRPVAPVPKPGPLATTNDEDAIKLLRGTLPGGHGKSDADISHEAALQGLTPSQWLSRLSAGESLELPAQMLGAAAVAPVAAGVKGVAGVALRSLAAGGGQATGEAIAGGSPSQIASAGATGVIAQPLAEGVTATANKVAPALAESALNITDKMRGRGRTIGDAVLENTTGIKASTLADETKQAIGSLVTQMETAVDQATQSGVTGSTQAAQQALTDRIADIPGNAKSIISKANGLRDLLDLPGSVPGSTSYTPAELLEMKRGIGMEMQSWPAEWQKMAPVKAIQSSLYGALDGELDNLVPGHADLNQVISSLIPAKQQAARISGGATIAQRMLHRAAAHTGALAASGIGGAVGYEKGGTPGAIAGAAAGLAIPEALASTGGQMAAARLINALGDKATDPAVLSIIKALAGSVGSQESK